MWHVLYTCIQTFCNLFHHKFNIIIKQIPINLPAPEVPSGTQVILPTFDAFKILRNAPKVPPGSPINLLTFDAFKIPPDTPPKVPSGPSKISFEVPTIPPGKPINLPVVDAPSYLSFSN